MSAELRRTGADRGAVKYKIYDAFGPVPSDEIHAGDIRVYKLAFM